MIDGSDITVDANIGDNTGTHDHSGKVEGQTSRIATDSGSAIHNDSSAGGSFSATRVGASRPDGTAVQHGPSNADYTVFCAGVYDESYAFFASTCP